MQPEDEFTLIVVGSILGLAVGYAQAAWDVRSINRITPISNSI